MGGAVQDSSKAGTPQRCSVGEFTVVGASGNLAWGSGQMGSWYHIRGYPWAGGGGPQRDGDGEQEGVVGGSGCREFRADRRHSERLVERQRGGQGYECCRGDGVLLAGGRANCAGLDYREVQLSAEEACHIEEACGGTTSGSRRVGLLRDLVHLRRFARATCPTRQTWPWSAASRRPQTGTLWSSPIVIVGRVGRHPWGLVDRKPDCKVLGLHAVAQVALPSAEAEIHTRS